MNYIKDMQDKQDDLREALITIRITEKISMKQLASAIGITIPTLNDFMTGDRTPHFTSLCKIKEFLESRGIVI